jgi:hypothetical protein
MLLCLVVYTFAPKRWARCALPTLRFRGTPIRGCRLVHSLNNDNVLPCMARQSAHQYIWPELGLILSV